MKNYTHLLKSNNYENDTITGIEQCVQTNRLRLSKMKPLVPPSGLLTHCNHGHWPPE